MPPRQENQSVRHPVKSRRHPLRTDPASGFHRLNKPLFYRFFLHCDTSIKPKVTGGDRCFINSLYKDFQLQKSPIRGFRITCHRPSPLQKILSLFKLQPIEKSALFCLAFAEPGIFQCRIKITVLSRELTIVRSILTVFLVKLSGLFRK